MQPQAYVAFAFLALITGLTAWGASRFEVKDDPAPKWTRTYDQPRWLNGVLAFAIGIVIAAAMAGLLVWLGRGDDIGISG